MPLRAAGRFSLLFALWTALVQHLPFASSEAPDTDPDRGASLDPWG
jgi:hypothetical protein